MALTAAKSAGSILGRRVEWEEARASTRVAASAREKTTAMARVNNKQQLAVWGRAPDQCQALHSRLGRHAQISEPEDLLTRLLKDLGEGAFLLIRSASLRKKRPRRLAGPVPLTSVGGPI